MNHTTADQPMALDERLAALAVTVIAFAFTAFMAWNLVAFAPSEHTVSESAAHYAGFGALLAASVWGTWIAATGVVEDFRAFAARR